MTDRLTARLVDRMRQARDAEREAALEKRRAAIIDAASGRPVDPAAMAHFLRYGFVTCPATRSAACDDMRCAAGAMCQRMALRGLYGDGSERPRKLRPACGAKTRSGGKCALRVEPGKKKCRLHGGLSTGPKTKEGRERIAAANRERWARRRQSG